MTEHPNKVVYALLDAETDLQARAWVFAGSRDVAILDKRYDRMVSVTLEQLRAILAAAEKAFEDELPDPEYVAAEERARAEALRSTEEALAELASLHHADTLSRFLARAEALVGVKALPGAEALARILGDAKAKVPAPAPTRAEKLRQFDEDIDLHATACGEHLAWVEKLDDEALELLGAIGSPSKGGLQSIVERGAPRFVYDGESVTAKVKAWQKRGLVEFWYPSRGVAVNLLDLGRSALAYHAKVKARAELLLAEPA